MLDAAQGSALKEQGMQLAIDFAGDWPEEVILELRAWLAVQKAIGLTNISIEQFRSQAKSQPDSHKYWGSLPRMACKAGLLAPMLDQAGERVYRRAASPKTHAHPVAMWRLL